MLNLITKFVNNCEVFILAKYDRKTPKDAFDITENPAQLNDRYMVSYTWIYGFL